MNTTPLMLEYKTLAIGYDQNHEAWLNRLADRMKPWFTALDKPLPAKLRIALGFTSMGKRSNRIGECWDNLCSADGHFEIFIRPDLVESPATMPGQIASILAHELVHAAVGITSKHGPKFAKVAKALGLVGKMTATVAGPLFIEKIEPMLIAVGELPHGRLNTGGLSTRAPKQTPRWLKATCPECGYIVRVSKKWLDAGFPICPTDHSEMLPDSIEGLRKAA